MTTKTKPKIFTRDFVLCFLTQFIFNFSAFALIPTLPIYLSRLGSTEVEIGVLTGSFAVASLVLRLFVGGSLERTSEKYFMTVGALFSAVAFIAYLVAPPFWPFLGVRVLQGIGFACFTTASFTLIGRIVPEAHRGKSLGYFILAFTLAGALAPPFGMVLINNFGFTYLFLVCFGLSLCSLFITHKLGAGDISPMKGPSVKKGRLFSGGALPPSLTGFYPFFVWGALATFFPIYALNHGMTNPGLFFSTSGLMLILGRVFGGGILDLYSREKIIAPFMIPYILSMILLAFSTTIPMFTLVAVIYGIGATFLIPALMAYAMDRGHSPGPAMATFQAVTDLGMSLGPVITGMIIQSTSYTIMFLCLAFLGIINLTYFYFFVRKKA